LDAIERKETPVSSRKKLALPLMREHEEMGRRGEAKITIIITAKEGI
jgi:hypothetical protein